MFLKTRITLLVVEYGNILNSLRGDEEDYQSKGWNFV